MKLYLHIGGYRAIAGPLVICMVSINKDLHDRKYFEDRLKDTARVHNWKQIETKVNRSIAEKEISVSTYIVSASVIDNSSIESAISSAYIRADRELGLPAIRTAIKSNQKGVPKKSRYFDLQPVSRCAETMLCSSVAYLLFSKEMDRIHSSYPLYGFNKNRGMVSSSHMEAILDNGPCSEHRYNAIKNFPNWIAKRAYQSSTLKELIKYRSCFVHTKLWWGSYFNYQLSMLDCLSDQSKEYLFKAFNRTTTDTWKTCDDDFYQWSLDNAPTKEDRDLLIRMKAEEISRWEAFMKKSLQSTDCVKAIHQSLIARSRVAKHTLKY